jgi:hypothetical protein
MHAVAAGAAFISNHPHCLPASLPAAEPGAAEVAQRAQQLLEHSLLGELRSVVARALSGLDMFEPQLKEFFIDSPSNVIPGNFGGYRTIWRGKE